MFHHVLKHLELSLKNLAVPRFSTSILSVWKHDATLVRVFDILREESSNPKNIEISVRL